jgi:hypothetical protein
VVQCRCRIKKGPRRCSNTPEPGPQKGWHATVDTTESSAPHAHPPAETHDHQEERPHVCNDGWVTIGQLVVDPETGEETEEYALYLCRKCAERS